MKKERDEKERKALHRWLLLMYIPIGIASLLLLSVLICVKYATHESWENIIIGLLFYVAVAILPLIDGLSCYHKGEPLPSLAYDEKEELPSPPGSNKE